MRKLTLIALVYFILARDVLAAGFTAVISPTLINSSKETQMQLNIKNLDTKNITQVNLTLPNNFYASCWDCISVGSVIYWVTNIQPDSSAEFNFRLIADVNGTYSFSISVLDSDNSSTQNYTNNFEVNDTTSPRWSNPVPGTASAPYSPGKVYKFNISWIDNVGLSHVIFFWQGSPITPNVTGSTYSVTLQDLPAGNYSFFWYANDTNKNSNQTSIFVYNVTKAPNPLNVYFNSTLNQNISMVNNTELTINVTGQGDLTLYQTGPANKSYTNFPQPFLPTRLGKYNFTATATGNANYTANSSTYFVMVVPRFTIQTSIPATYSTATTFTVIFSSPPELDTLLIEGSWSATRHRMTNSSATEYSYSIVLPAGSFNWQLYINSSKDIIPLTEKNSFTIAKATPTLILTASPAWVVKRGTQTTVKCTSVVPVTLYRNNTQVSNPDVQTLSVDSYTYVCVGSETQNYTSTSEYATLIVTREPFADFVFAQTPSIIIVEQASSNATVIIINNTGTVSQTISLTIENISTGLWSINTTNITLSPGATGAFLVNFSVRNESAGDYLGIFKASSPNKTITSNFTLRVLLSQEAKAELNKTLEGYKLELLALEAEMNRAREAGFNVTPTEKMLNTLRSIITQAESYVQRGDYTTAARILQNVGNLPSEIRNELERIKASGNVWPNYTIYVIIGVAVGLVVLFAYLLWPTEVVSKTEALPRPEKKSFLERLKEIFIWKRKYKYKG